MNKSYPCSFCEIMHHIMHASFKWFKYCYYKWSDQRVFDCIIYICFILHLFLIEFSLMTLSYSTIMDFLSLTWIIPCVLNTAWDDKSFSFLHWTDILPDAHIFLFSCVIWVQTSWCMSDYNTIKPFLTKIWKQALASSN